jgi:hypothetical protein
VVAVGEVSAVEAAEMACREPELRQRPLRSRLVHQMLLPEPHLPFPVTALAPLAALVRLAFSTELVDAIAPWCGEPAWKLIQQARAKHQRFAFPVSKAAWFPRRASGGCWPQNLQDQRPRREGAILGRQAVPVRR